MLKIPRRDPDQDGTIFGMHPGDIGTVVIAALCTFALIAVLVVPSPFAKLEQQQAAADKAQRQKEIDKAVASGEVSVGILPANSH